MTLTNGVGGNQDWLGLAASGAPNTSYLTYTYVGAGVATRTWTVSMPTTLGTYEFRLFADDGYVRLATSPTVTVANGNPIPAVTSVAPPSVVAGSAGFTLTVAGTGFVNGSVVQVDGSNRTTTYGSATQLTAAILASDVASAGTHTITVFSPTPGGGPRAGRP